jgi:hypothetical protein
MRVHSIRRGRKAGSNRWSPSRRVGLSAAPIEIVSRSAGPTAKTTVGLRVRIRFPPPVNLYLQWTIGLRSKSPAARSVPVTTISTSRLPHSEQRSRSRQSGTVVSVAGSVTGPLYLNLPTDRSRPICDLQGRCRASCSTGKRTIRFRATGRQRCAHRARTPIAPAGAAPLTRSTARRCERVEQGAPVSLKLPRGFGLLGRQGIGDHPAITPARLRVRHPARGLRTSGRVKLPGRP